MKIQRRITNNRILPHPHGCEPIRASSARERGILEREPHVERDGGVEAQSLADAMLEVWHIGLEIVIRWRFMRSDLFEDLVAELAIYVGVGGEFFEEEGEGAGCGVSACEEDVYDLIADDCVLSCLVVFYIIWRATRKNTYHYDPA